MTSTTTRPRRRRWVTLVSTVVLTIFAVLLASVLWVQITGSSRAYSETAVPDAPVAIVFGAGLTPAGRPSPYLAARLEVAAELYENKKVQAILVSGDNSTTTYDEPTVMREYLAERGIPYDVVVLDYAGFDTHDTCVRANQVFGVTQATVVTQDYHLPRAVFSCSQAGIETNGVGAEAIGGPITTYQWREYAASIKAAFDAVTSRTPVFLGPRETDLQEILGE